MIRFGTLEDGALGFERRRSADAYVAPPAAALHAAQ